MKRDRDRARRFAVTAVRRAAFAGRKGHGGAVAITRRVLTPEQLEGELHKAISRYTDALSYFERNPTKTLGVAEFAARLGVRKCADPDCPNPVDTRGADGSDGVRCTDHDPETGDNTTEEQGYPGQFEPADHRRENR